MESEELELTPAKEFIQAAQNTRKKVRAPSRMVYGIKPIPNFILLGVYGGIPDAVAMSAGKNGDGISEDEALQLAAKACAEKADEMQERFWRVLRLGIWHPVLDDMIKVETLPTQDTGFLFQSIMNISSGESEVTDAIRPTSQIVA